MMKCEGDQSLSCMRDCNFKTSTLSPKKVLRGSLREVCFRNLQGNQVRIYPHKTVYRISTKIKEDDDSNETENKIKIPMHIYPKEFKQINENNKQNTCCFTNFLPFLSYCGAFIRLLRSNSPPSLLINKGKCLPILPDVLELGLVEMITKVEFS